MINIHIKDEIGLIQLYILMFLLYPNTGKSTVQFIINLNYMNNLPLCINSELIFIFHKAMEKMSKMKLKFIAFLKFVNLGKT